MTFVKHRSRCSVEIRNTKKENALELFLYLLFFLASAFFVYSQGQDINWDLLNYHFYQGYSLLNGRFVMDIAAAKLQSFLNPTVNVLAYVSLTHLPFPLSAWSILFVQLSGIPAIILLAKEIAIGLGYPRNSIPVVSAIALSLQAPLWWSELGTTYFSSWTASLIIWGVYFIFSACQEFGLSTKRIAMAGVLFGLATGLKLTNAPFAASGFLMIAALLYRSNWRASVLVGIYFIAACGVGFLLTAWWNWYLWSVWGSPLFPLYNAIFKSEFFDFENFRDMRWRFSSFQEFLMYIVQSAWGTVKTSEVEFADARYLFLIMLLPAAILSRPAVRLNKQLIAFILFMASAFVLWALMFAYQRYLIPFELLLGLLIWVLVVRIVESDWLRKTLMIGLSLCMVLLIKVPDWGHAPMAMGGKNPFSIEMDEEIYATPARYVVVGSPMSYILPSFHSGSIFYGVDFSRQVDELIFRRLAKSSELPLRVLAKDSDAILMPEIFKRVGYDSHRHFLSCKYFRTGIGRYVVCELQFQRQQSVVSNPTIYADFTENGYLKKRGLLWERGLSSFEPWGRWSDQDRVEFGLTGCLPQGRLKFIFVGHAFGPNIGLPVKISMGDKEVVTFFSDADSKQVVHFKNDAACLDKVVIKVPKPTSPQELGLSADARKLGIGFVSLKIIKE